MPFIKNHRTGTYSILPNKPIKKPSRTFIAPPKAPVPVIDLTVDKPIEEEKNIDEEVKPVVEVLDDEPKEPKKQPIFVEEDPKIEQAKKKLEDIKKGTKKPVKRGSRRKSPLKKKN